MKQEGLVSKYTVAQFRPHHDKCNASKVANLVDRKFSNRPLYNVVVSDLTYVRVGLSWNYICVLIDLFNREIIGFSTGRRKDAALVYRAFANVKTNLKQIHVPASYGLNYPFPFCVTPLCNFCGWQTHTD